MIEIGKYKVSNLAKDLRLKNKDITDVLDKNGYHDRTHSSILTADEYNFLMNYFMNQNQIVDINSYMDKKTQIVDPTIVKLVKTAAPVKKTTTEGTQPAQKPKTEKAHEPAKQQNVSKKETPKTENVPAAKQQKPKDQKPQTQKNDTPVAPAVKPAEKATKEEKPVVKSMDKPVEVVKTEKMEKTTS